MLNFEIPYDMRALTESSMGQARDAYDWFANALIEMNASWLSAMPQNQTTTKLKAVHERTIRFCARNVDAGLSYVSELAGARDLADVLSVQRRFFEAQMQNYAREVREMGEDITSAAEDLRRPH